MNEQAAAVRCIEDLKDVLDRYYFELVIDPSSGALSIQNKITENLFEIE